MIGTVASSWACFFIVLAFNIYWIMSYGRAPYDGSVSTAFSIFVWLYAAWGLFNLYHGIKGSFF